MCEISEHVMLLEQLGSLLGEACVLCIANEVCSTVIHPNLKQIALQELAIAIPNLVARIHPEDRSSLDFIARFFSSLAQPICAQLTGALSEVATNDLRIIVKTSIATLAEIASISHPVAAIAKEALLLWATSLCDALSPGTDNGATATQPKTLVLRAMVETFPFLCGLLDLHAQVVVPWVLTLLDSSRDPEERRWAWEWTLMVILPQACQIQMDMVASLRRFLLESCFKFPEVIVAGLVRDPPNMPFICLRELLSSASLMQETKLWSCLTTQADLLSRGLSNVTGTDIAEFTHILYVAMPISRTLLNSLGGFLLHALVVKLDDDAERVFEVLGELLSVSEEMNLLGAIGSRQLSQIALGALQRLNSPLALGDQRLLYRLLEILLESQAPTLSSIALNKMVESLKANPDPSAIRVIAKVIPFVSSDLIVVCLEILCRMIGSVPDEVRVSSETFVNTAVNAIRSALVNPGLDMFTSCLEAFEMLVGDLHRPHLMIVTEDCHRLVIQLLLGSTAPTGSSTSAADDESEQQLRRKQKNLAVMLLHIGYFNSALEWFRGTPDLTRRVLASILQAVGFSFFSSSSEGDNASSSLIGLDLTLGANWQRHLDRVGSTASLLTVWGMCFPMDDLDNTSNKKLGEGLLRWISSCKSSTQEEASADELDLLHEDLLDHNDLDVHERGMESSSPSTLDWTVWMLLYAKLLTSSFSPSQSAMMRKLRRTMVDCWFRTLRQSTREEIVKGLVLVAETTETTSMRQVMRVLLDLDEQEKQLRVLSLVDEEESHAVAFRFWRPKDLVEMLISESSQGTPVALDIANRLCDPQAVELGVDLLGVKEELIKQLNRIVLLNDFRSTIQSDTKRWMWIISWLASIAEDDDDDSNCNVLCSLSRQISPDPTGPFLTPFAASRLLSAKKGNVSSNALELRAALLRLVDPKDFKTHREPFGLFSLVIERLSSIAMSSSSSTKSFMSETAMLGDLNWLRMSLQLGILPTKGSSDGGENQTLLVRVLAPLLAQQKLHPLCHLEAANVLIETLRSTNSTDIRNRLAVLLERVFFAGLQMIAIPSSVVMARDGAGAWQQAGFELMIQVSLSSLMDQQETTHDDEGYVSVWLEDYLVTEFERINNNNSPQEKRFTMIRLLAFVVLMRGSKWSFVGDDHDLIWSQCVSPLLFKEDWYDETHLVSILVIVLLLWKRLLSHYGHDHKVERLEARLRDVQQSFFSSSSSSSSSSATTLKHSSTTTKSFEPLLKQIKQSNWMLNRSFAIAVIDLIWNHSVSSASSKTVMKTIVETILSQ